MSARSPPLARSPARSAFPRAPAAHPEPPREYHLPRRSNPIPGNLRAWSFRRARGGVAVGACRDVRARVKGARIELGRKLRPRTCRAKKRSARSNGTIFAGFARLALGGARLVL
eukprot:6316725-Prymnesium_polylepis.1